MCQMQALEGRQEPLKPPLYDFPLGLWHHVLRHFYGSLKLVEQVKRPYRPHRKL
jgi:hypothetical protein